MTPEQQASFQAAADKAIDWSTAAASRRARSELVEFFKGKGLEDLHARRRRLPRAMRRRSIWRPTSPRAGRRAWSTRSTRSERVAAQRRHRPQRPVALPPPFRGRRESLRSNADGIGDDDPDRFATLGGWLRRRAENVAAAMLAVMFARLHPADRLPLPAQLPDRLDHRAQRRSLWLWLVLWGAAFVVREERGDPLRHHLRRGRRRGRRRVMAVITAAALIVLYAVSLPAVVDYVTFMKVAEDGLSEDPLRLALLDLRRLRRRHRSSATSGSPGRRYRGEAPEAFDPTKAGSGV